MTSVTGSLSKIYSGVLDGLIEAKSEEKIKTEFIPKTKKLNLDSVAQRAQDFLDEEEAKRKAEEERKRREEERKKLQEEARKKAEEEERKRLEEERRRKEEEKRRKEEERKAEEARKEAERKKAEAERLKREKEEEEKRLAILKAEKEAAEKKAREEKEAEEKRLADEEKKRQERERQADLKRKAQDQLMMAMQKKAEKKRKKAEAQRRKQQEELEAKRQEERERKTAELKFMLPGPPAGLPPGAQVTNLPGPPPGPPPSAIDEMHASQKLDEQLQDAISAKDIALLNTLLEKATMNTKTVRYARNLKMKLEDLRKISEEIKEAIDNIDIPKLKQLLNKGYQLGLTQNELVKTGRHLCYGLSTADQLTLKIKKAMADKNLEKLKDLLDEAQADFIDNEDIENARTFLALNTSREVWSSHKMQRYQEDEDDEMQYEGYKKFIQLKGQCPISKCRLLRHEANYAKRKYLSEQASKSKRLQWQRDDIPRSLLKLSTAYCGNNRALSRHIKIIAKQLFKNVRGYMGDHYHPYPITLAYEVVNVGVNEPLLRDEIFTQLIKQTTLNPRPESTLLGMKLFYLCISTFAPSSNLTPFVMSHLAMFAHAELPSELVGFNSIEDLATNCWISYDLLARTVGPGETGDPPSMQDIEQLTMGKLTPMNDEEMDDDMGFAPPGLPPFDESMLPGPPDGAPPPGPPPGVTDF